MQKFLLIYTRLLTAIISSLAFIAIAWAVCSQGMAVALILPPSPLSAFWSEDYRCKNNLFKAEDVQGPFGYRGCNAVRFYPIPSQLGSYFQRFGYNL